MYIPNAAHCRKFGYKDGDCERLHCQRCGMLQYRRIAHRIIAATMQQAKIFFVTIYYARRKASLLELPLFAFGERDEKNFRLLLTSVLASLRKLARRKGKTLEYCAVIAFGKVSHRIHKNVHSHLLVTWLPDHRPKVSKAHPDRLECPWLAEKVASLGLEVWIEEPRSKLAVARYSVANLKPIIGKPEMRGIRAYRFSKGYEK